MTYFKKEKKRKQKKEKGNYPSIPMYFNSKGDNVHSYIKIKGITVDRMRAYTKKLNTVTYNLRGFPIHVEESTNNFF